VKRKSGFDLFQECIGRDNLYAV